MSVWIENGKGFFFVCAAYLDANLRYKNELYIGGRGDWMMLLSRDSFFYGIYNKIKAFA